MVQCTLAHLPLLFSAASITFNQNGLFSCHAVERRHRVSPLAIWLSWCRHSESNSIFAVLHDLPKEKRPRNPSPLLFTVRTCLMMCRVYNSSSFQSFTNFSEVPILPIACEGWISRRSIFLPSEGGNVKEWICILHKLKPCISYSGKKQVPLQRSSIWLGLIRADHIQNSSFSWKKYFLPQEHHIYSWNSARKKFKSCL